MSFINFPTNSGHSFGGLSLEIKPDRFIKHSNKFDNLFPEGEMSTSICHKKVSCRTELRILQKGISVKIQIEMYCLGWQESLEKSMKLVEQEIPDA